MEQPIIEKEKVKDDNVSPEELREMTSTRSQLTNLFSKKSTYISSSKKFEWKKQEVVFSLFYSFIISLIPAIIFSVLLLINDDFNSSFAKIGNRFLLVLSISTGIFFVLRIFLKRWLEILSIVIFGIIILYYAISWLMIPHHRNICQRLNGVWQKDSSLTSNGNEFLDISYTCYIDKEAEKNIPQNGSSPFNPFSVRFEAIN